MLVIDYAASRRFALPVRFAALDARPRQGQTPREEWPRHIGHEERSVELIGDLCERLRVPNDCRELALLAARHHGEIHRAEELRPATIVKLLERTDALRRPERFEELLLACACDFHGRPGFESLSYAPAPLLRTALEVEAAWTRVRSRGAAEPKKIAAAVHEARARRQERMAGDGRHCRRTPCLVKQVHRRRLAEGHPVVLSRLSCPSSQAD